MGVWSQGGWAGDTPFEGRAGLCGQGEKAFRALPTCMAAQPLTAGLGGVGGTAPMVPRVLTHLYLIPLEPCCVEGKLRPREATCTQTAGLGIQVLRRLCV